MFCPKCATQNIEGASFCRVCGANISLVPQALTGQLARPTDAGLDRYSRRGRRRGPRQPTLEEAIRQMMSGVGFLLVAIAISVYAPAGRLWWFWLLIPAFSLLGKGIAELVRARQLPRQTPQPPPEQLTSSAPPVGGLRAPNTNELPATPPSVTEGTTRHLGVEAPTRHFDSSNEVGK
jgi:zinc-ribbon domain